MIEAPIPIDNPDHAFRELRVSLLTSTKNSTPGQLYSISNGETNNPFDFNPMQERLSSIDSPLKSIIFNGDEEILSELKNCSYRYSEALSGELNNLDSEYSYISHNKYKKTSIGTIDINAPERDEYLSRGLKVFDRRIPQFIQTIQNISASSSRNDKLNLLKQCQEKYQKDIKVSKDTGDEMLLRQRERGN